MSDKLILNANPFTVREKMTISPEGSLNLRATQMLLWIRRNKQPGTDFVYLDRDSYMKEHHISFPTFKSALNPLIQYGVIIESITKGVYWINPDIV